MKVIILMIVAFSVVIFGQKPEFEPDRGFIVRRGGLQRLDSDDGAVEIHFAGDKRSSNEVKKIVVKCDNKKRSRSRRLDASCERRDSHDRSDSRESRRRNHHYWRRSPYASVQHHDFGNLIHEYAICPDVYCPGNKVALRPPTCYCGCGNFEEMRGCFAGSAHYIWDSELCQCLPRYRRDDWNRDDPVGCWMREFWEKLFPRVVE